MRILIIMMLLFLSGCVEGPEPWTREKQTAETVRFYQGVRPQDAIQAAERLFRLADPNDTQFNYRDNGFVAERKAFIYAIVMADFTTYNFDVRVSAAPGGAKVEMRAGQLSNTATAAGMMPSGGGLNRAPGLYRLFFARMDYLLGQSDTWVTCKEARKVIKERTFSYEPLCLAAEDNSPE